MGRRFRRYYRLRYGAQRLTGRQVAAAVTGGAVIALASHHSSAGSVASAAAMSAAGGGGSLSCSGLEALWESAGGSPGATLVRANLEQLRGDLVGVSGEEVDRCCQLLEDPEFSFSYQPMMCGRGRRAGPGMQQTTRGGQT